MKSVCQLTGVRTQCRRSPLRWLLIPLEGGELRRSGKAPRGRAERWRLVPLHMVHCGGSGTISVWLRSRGGMLGAAQATTPPTPLTLTLAQPRGRSPRCPLPRRRGGPSAALPVVLLALLFHWVEDKEASDVPVHFTASYVTTCFGAAGAAGAADSWL